MDKLKTTDCDNSEIQPRHIDQRRAIKGQLPPKLVLANRGGKRGTADEGLKEVLGLKGSTKD